MKKILGFILFFSFINISFWFSNIEKTKISQFVNSQNDYEKQIFIVEKLLWVFSRKTDVDFLLSLKQELIVKNLENKKIFVTKQINQKLQEKPLSCESNSASLFASYFLETEISESQIFDKIPKNTSKIQRTPSKFIWWNPYTEFVWNINGKQTKSIANFTWYWVYAYPISNVLHDLWIKNEVKKFKKYEIVESILENKPVIFWYLDENEDGKIDTKPLVWYTQNWEKISWYVWQHTWLIIWISFYNNWDINEVYFYEWNNLDVQVVKYSELAYKAWFFDMMIVKK